MANELRYTLDTARKEITYNSCKQLDDRTLILTLFDNGQTLNISGATLILNIKRADGSWIKQTTGITIASNIVTIALIRDATRVAGTVELELLIVIGGKNTTTFTFDLRVIGSVIQDGDLQSKDSITAVEQLNNTIATALSTINNAISNVNTVKKQLDASVSNGDTKQMRSDIDDINSSRVNPNLIPNGAFENFTKFNYWAFSEYRNSGSVKLGWNNGNDAKYIIGDYTPYMRALGLANTEVGGVIGGTFIAVEPNKTYTLSYLRQLFRGKVSHEHAFFSGTANIGYILTDTKTIVSDEANRIIKGTVWEDIGNTNETTVNGSMWKKVSITFTTPPTCNQVKFADVLQYSYSDAFYFWDNVKLEEGTKATSYIEAMQPIIDNTLATDNKYIVGAINEMFALIKTLISQLGNVAGIRTANKDIANAINEMNNKVSVMASGTNGNGSWVKLHDGTIVQYGRGIGYKVGVEYDHTLPIAYSDKCYFAIAEIISRDSLDIAYTEYANVRTSSPDKTKIHFKVGNPITGAESMTFNIGWMTIGK
ncbi:hypothetical protein NNC19_07160 [Clostridium sp. SHJSY1]|uniref:gp53-like domain-containing protein n=1 Tax=Clostridium sp. SHJSY1 TaxID=2942483 RepID=UPI00287441ED|nr:hypothetical protein [Clostridium sp. SHJSY1]MDS0525452.1 hypothetical protein [Clostridium sp. SHJSY1]